MRALTLIRPMAAAIVHGSKRIENRPRDLPKNMHDVQTIVAVHAGKKWDEAYADVVHEIDGDHCVTDEFGQYVTPYEDRIFDEGIVGLMRLSGRTFTCRPSGIVADDWWSGPFGYEILDAVAFEAPIPCRGALGWWTVPDDVLKAMRICSACGWHHQKGQPIKGCILR